MLKICVMLMMLNSIMTSLVHSPMIMGAALLIQTIMSSFVVRFFTCSSWTSLTMFLVMVSGLLIIFTYVSSINTNNKFKIYSWNNLMYSIPMLIFISSFKMNFIISDTLQLKDLFNTEFSKLYTMVNMWPSLFMFIYLLLMLIIMINLMKKTKGPLRKKY